LLRSCSGQDEDFGAEQAPQFRGVQISCCISLSECVIQAGILWCCATFPRELARILQQFDKPGCAHSSCALSILRERLSLGCTHEKRSSQSPVLDLSVYDMESAIILKQKYVDKLPRSSMQVAFLQMLPRFACIPSGSTKPFLNAGSLVGAYAL